MGIEFLTVGSFQTGTVPRNLDHRTLHPQTDSKVRNPFLPGKLNRFDLPFNPSCPEPSGDEDAIGLLKKMFWPLLLHLL